MKNYILFIALFIVTAATAQNCDIVYGTITNGVRTNTAATVGGLDNSLSGLDIAEAHTFTKSLWVGGWDPGGNLKIAANTYIDPNRTDFHAGALDPVIGISITDIDQCSDSKKMWVFKDSDIISLKTKFAAGALSALDLTEDLLSYPGRNNVWYEQVMGYQLNQDLAPFMDFNSDGKYNPLDGDYPIALEENSDFLPVEFSFTSYQDAIVHTSTTGAQIQLEVHQTSYVCFEAGNDLLNHTVFQRLKLINRATTYLEDIKIGLFIDDQLGASVTDDYTGCDPALNAVYSYNGQNGIDEIDGSTGVKLHLWLNRNIDSSMPIYRAGLGGPDVTPVSNIDYYNMLESEWKDGTPLTAGGSGYDTSAVNTASFAFPDPPSDPNGWSMVTAASQAGFIDIRSVTAFTRDTLKQNESIILDLADVALVDPATTGFEKIDDLTNIVAQIKNKYNGVATSSTTEAIKNIKLLRFSPNPAIAFISHGLPRNQSYTFDIYDVAGRLMDRQTLPAHDTEISLSKLSQGVFMIRTRDKQGDVHVGKIVKI